jgi:adenine-specific DNA-methyltransferase
LGGAEEEMWTQFHAKYYAYELTRRRSSEKLEKLSQSFFNATVDLNPHQLDAAIFAFRSPLSRGAILADEVGLGKTIEAGLIIAQLWAERKRRILCIVPAALRKQWNRELLEKFFIESCILESANYNKEINDGCTNPLEKYGTIILCSYHFARARASDIQAVPWDLVVLDEAHRLRNVYKKDNKIARSIRSAIEGRPKILLTATPLQNSLMELYGLVSFIDPYLFGSEGSFRQQCSRRLTSLGSDEFTGLSSRIRPICQRTLRRQVTEYINYTDRLSITQDFTPTDAEVRLYNYVSDYLQRPDSIALPAGQRALMTLVLRKILASSSFAIAATLGKMADRLDAMAQAEIASDGYDESEIAEDFDPFVELVEESGSGSNDGNQVLTSPKRGALPFVEAIRAEAKELRAFQKQATSITTNAKGEALLVALQRGFEKMDELHAARKALIFTESRRTQRYLLDLLQENGYAGQIVLLSGYNNDPDSKKIYQAWLDRHRGEDTITGSPTSDMRSALVEEFQERAAIMIATESGAEGVNLQFCSLVVNYDLPWNPQRIEQRIGRCHRYGQRFDVVVINFLNRRNAADRRVFELLGQKFRLFEGVFGASDEVLGALDAGVDFERRINEIYQSCRSEDEINRAFDVLQTELEQEIKATLEDTRAKLMEHFDEEVHRRLRLQAEAQITRLEQWLFRLIQHGLEGYATFNPERYEFTLSTLPPSVAFNEVPLGLYRLVTRSDSQPAYHLRLGHPLVEHLIAQAKASPALDSEVTFDYSNHPRRISDLEMLKGRAGWLRAAVLRIRALEEEEHLLLSMVTDDGELLDKELAANLFLVQGTVGKRLTPPLPTGDRLNEQQDSLCQSFIKITTQRNQAFFEEEMEKLEAWADDLKESLETEIKELDREIKGTKRDARIAGELEQKVNLHRRAKELERRRQEKRHSLFDAQDEIDVKKEDLINKVEKRLRQSIGVECLFNLRWVVV